MFIAQASITLTDVASNLNEALVAVHNALHVEDTVEVKHLHVARWATQHGREGKTLVAIANLEIHDENMGVAISRFEFKTLTSEGTAEFEITAIDAVDLSGSHPGAL